MSDLGPLAAALAKARLEFPPINRTKTVETPKYKFDYAPLDAILAAVTEPLSKNGLVVVQSLDDGALVTTLLHESGAAIGGSIDLPATDNMQSLGSAITYLRRYAIQAVLGIAAEEDDDGSRGSGTPASVRNRSKAQPKAEEDDKPEYVSQGFKAFSGKVAKGDGQFNDVQYHEGPSGHLIGFRLELEGGSAIHEVMCQGPIGEALFLAVPAKELLGATVDVEGEAFRIDQQGRRARARLVVSRIKGPGWTIPAPEAPSIPLFEGLDAEDQASVDAALAAL